MSASTCPPWCAEPDCGGEHYSDVEYRPATGRLSAAVDVPVATLPLVGVGVSWISAEDRPPCVTVYAPSAGMSSGESQLDLLPHEARRLVADLTEALERLEQKTS